MSKKMTVLAAALLCLSLLAGALGCGGSSRPDPKQTVTDFWNAIKAGDYNKALSYMSTTLNLDELRKSLQSDEPGQKEITDALVKKMNMVPKSSKVDGDNATVTTEVTMPDMEKLMDEMFKIVGEMMESGVDITAMSEDEITAALMAKVGKILQDLPTVTKTMDIKMVWEGGAWKMKTNPFEEIEKAFEQMGG
jgi:hypothetical protein